LSKLKCQFEKCGGVLMPNDNDKTPKGLFKCKKCKSIFRMMIDNKKLVLVTNLFTVTYNSKPISLKELKANK
jgi:hypothetical protein